MCGIVGFSGDFRDHHLTMMLDQVRYRGPDDEGKLVLQTRDSVVGLGHRRLSIIDLSNLAHQPMTTVCKQCQQNPIDVNKVWLVFNGEIYNFKQLRNQLQQSGHTFCSNSDSEVLIHMYTEFGLDMLKQLNGIFALAIYDGRLRGQSNGIQPGDLILVRDNVGVKPLYYAETHKGFLFASELKSIIATTEVITEINFAALNAYMTYLWCPAPDTMLKEVKKIRPGEVLVVRGNKIINKYIYQELPQSQPYLSTKCFSDLKSELIHTLTDSVARQMISDVPVGAFLSGGLDSSAVVAMMKQHDPQQKIDCFTVKFKNIEKKYDFAKDLYYAQLVSKNFGLSLHEIEITSDVFANLTQMIYHLDEPIADPAAINTLLICQVAQSKGIKVLLSGAGGDDIFSGYRRHEALSVNKYVNILPQNIRRSFANVAKKFQAGNYHYMDNQLIPRLSKLLAYSDLSPVEQLTTYFKWGSDTVRQQLYTDTSLAQINYSTLTSGLDQSLQIVTGLDPLSQMLYLEQKHFLADHNLNYIDKMSMACGIEVRVPFLDKHMLEFAAMVPSKYKLSGRKTKYIFHQAMQNILPSEVINRVKVSFGVPLRNWFFDSSIITDILESNSLARRGIFNPLAVASLVKAQKKGTIDAAYTLFAVACVELWFQIFIDRKHGFLCNK